jgi:hypothetical protein
MVCGTGKTLVGLLVAKARARARLSSSPRPRYLPRRYASGPRTPERALRYLAVCSDETVVGEDAVVSTTSEPSEHDRDDPVP